MDVAGRFALIYREGKKKMAIGAEMTMDGFAISVASIGRWDDDPLHETDEEEKRRIVANVRRALESQGERVHLL